MRIHFTLLKFGPLLQSILTPIRNNRFRVKPYTANDILAWLEAEIGHLDRIMSAYSASSNEISRGHIYASDRIKSRVIEAQKRILDLREARLLHKQDAVSILQEIATFCRNQAKIASEARGDPSISPCSFDCYAYGEYSEYQAGYQRIDLLVDRTVKSK